MVQLHIEAVQTVMPSKPTDPRQSMNVNLPQNLSSTTILQRRFSILLCYNKASHEDSGWLFTGWIKESLGRALSDQPIFAGRLRRNKESGSDWHIVPNDSGVRLVEGKVDVNLADFLDLKAKSEIEGELVFWDDVLAHDPQFSPLFYVQVSNFTCGGYSIGISCSLFLADPFVLTKFIRRWANLHDNIVQNVSKIPTFYLPNLAKPGTSPTLVMGSKSGKTAGQSVTFKIPTKILNFYDPVYKNLAALCIDKAEHVVGRKMASKFCLFVKMASEDVKVEVCSREETCAKSLDVELDCGSSMWDEMKVEKISFNEGNQPGYGSYWINSMLDEGSVMIIESQEVNTLQMKIVVTFN